MTRGKKIGIGIAVVVVALGIAFRVRVWPWVASPDPAAVVSAWAEVEKAAKESAPAPAADERFEVLFAALSKAGPDLDRMAKQGNARTADLAKRSDAKDGGARGGASSGPLEREEDTLPEGVKVAFDALAAWAQNAAIDDAAASCTTKVIPIVPIMRLSELALTTPPIAAHAVTLTTLSERLRRRGGLLDYAVGMKIFERVLERAAVNPQGLPPYLRDTKADGREMRSAIARMRVCEDRMFEGGVDLGAPREDGPAAPWPAGRAASVERERAMVRLFWGEQMRVAAQTEDPGAIAKAFAIHDLEQLPKSYAVRMFAISPDTTLESAVRVIKRYEELLKKK